MVRGRYGQFKVCVDGVVAIDGGAAAAFGIMPSGAKIVAAVKERLVVIAT